MTTRPTKRRQPATGDMRPPTDRLPPAFQEPLVDCMHSPIPGLPVIIPDHLDRPRPYRVDFLGGTRPLPPLPIPKPFPGPVKPLPLLTIRLQLIATTNDFPIDPQRFAPILPDLNANFSRARVEFVFDPVKDYLVVDDFQLDQDFELVDPGSLSNPANDPPAVDWSRFHAARQAMAKSHHGKLVVYVSRGTVLEWDAGVGAWALRDRGFHFSGTASDYVVTAAYYWRPGVSGLPMDANTLAHEIGHYLHLSHTMWPMPKNIAEAAASLRQAVDVWGWNANDAPTLYDADLPFVSDTPPDPGPDLLGSVNAGDPCGLSNFVDVPVAFASGLQRTYRLQPDRTNLMSYFKGCPGPHGFSASQIRRMRVAVERGNRQHLLSGRDTFVPDTPVAAFAASGLGVVALDLTQSTWYLKWDGPATALTPRWIWLGGYFASIAGARDAFGNIQLVGRDLAGKVHCRSLPSPLATVTQAWQPLGTITVNANPAVVSRLPSFLDYFGTDRNGGLNWLTIDASGHASGWRNIGGNCLGSPAACSWGPGRIDVVVRQADRTFSHAFWDGLQWSALHSLGPETGQDPVLLATVAGRLELVMRDQWGGVWRRSFSNGQWSAYWEWLGGGFVGQCAVAAGSGSRFDLVARSPDGALWYREWTGSGWSSSANGWRPLGGRSVASPSICTSASPAGGRRLDIFARLADGGIVHASLDGNNAQEPGPMSWITTPCPAIV